ncbi:MAG: hybrid sensor histidine kinase/response regulator transcription factor, partial [Calditrichaeota bacterium]|nr:hybrid sensor histidine kinase/response regulator transcription factor [Calditrichota bacterium]
VIYPEKDGVVWFGGSEGIARFASAIPKDYKVDFSTEIRKVATISSDSVFYSGSGLSSFPRSEMNYGDNSLRFEFAALSYDDVSANRYQVKLDGFDADWSAWTNETKKDYTSLSAGDYTFRARARNIYGHQSSEGRFALTVLPPWYQGLWAYGVYLFVCVSLVYGVVRLRVRQLTKKTEQLEAVVAERTTKLQEQAVKLKELDVMKSRFFANISHEFRTPLTLILGPIEDMLEKTKQHKTKEKLQLVQRSARRLQRLINQLLDLSRLETGKMQLQAYRGDFVEFLRSLVLAFASLAESKSMDLEFEVGPTKPCEGSKPSQGFVDMYFDRDKIEKIFSNLLSNALKFTPVGGKVAVKVTAVTATPPAEADRIEIMVQDTGPGIPADRLPFIFDRFYQVDATSTREREGTGIGLALVKELVELHHGQIGVESRGGEGTTFKVTLPLGKAHLRDEEMASSAPQPETASLYHQPGVESEANTPPSPSPDFDEDATVVLVVEDHADVRRYIRGHLQSDYRIVEADDGREGVRVALEVIPDLVISDVMMPKLDGYELCETLKTDEKTSHIPVILLTARAGEEDKLTGLDTGADDYLVKPFNARELQARVRNLIEQRRKLRQRFIREGMLKPREIDAQSLDDVFLQKLMSNMEERMADENFSVEELSQKMNMGPRHLHRKVRALTNKSPVELIRLVRLQRARQLLAQNAGTVSEIAYQVGFTNLSHFSKIFKEEFGKLPSEM